MRADPISLMELVSPRGILYAVAFLVLGITFPCSAGQNSRAPLPEKLVSARTAYLQNDSGEQGFADAVYRHLQEWGRWRIVTNKSEADIILALDHKDALHNYFYLRISEPTTGQVLWLVRKDAAIRVWNRVAKALLANLTKQMPGAQTEQHAWSKSAAMTTPGT